MFMTVKQAAEKWGISDRRIRVLCAEGKVPGAYREGRRWKIPVDANKPADGRYKSKESIFSQINRKKKELDSCRPLTEGEVERLSEEFIVEYTYNSNAIEGNTLTLRETDLVLRGLTIDQKPLKDHMEAVGHKEAFDFVSELVKEVTFEDEIQSVFYGEDTVGLVFEDVEEKMLTLYDLKGNLLSQIPFSMEYDSIRIADNRVLIYNDTEMGLYSFHGKENFRYTFEDSMVEIFPTKSRSKYLFIYTKETQMIKLQ